MYSVATVGIVYFDIDNESNGRWFCWNLNLPLALGAKARIMENLRSRGIYFHSTAREIFMH